MASASSVHFVTSALLHEIFSHVYMGANRFAGQSKALKWVLIVLTS